MGAQKDIVGTKKGASMRKTIATIVVAATLGIGYLTGLWALQHAHAPEPVTHTVTVFAVDGQQLGALEVPYGYQAVVEGHVASTDEDWDGVPIDPDSSITIGDGSWVRVMAVRGNDHITTGVIAGATDTRDM